MIAAYYYIKYNTVDIFTQSLSAKTKLKGLIDIISHASEFDDLPIRYGEAQALDRLAGHLPVKIDTPKFNDANIKVRMVEA